MTRIKKYLWPLTFLLCTISAQAQKYTSEEASLRLNNIPKTEKIVEADITPPVIEIIDPQMDFGTPYKVENPELTIVGHVSDESGVSYIVLNSKFIEISDKGYFTAELDLSEGLNEIKIIANDTKNNTNRTAYEVEYKRPVVTLADKINKESNYFGLIIGVDNYLDEDINDLDNPIEDARRLRDALINNYTFKEENVKFLGDPTYAELCNAFQELSKTVSENDNLLIFYAGHGVWDEKSNLGYWLPSDASNDNNAFWFRNSVLVDYLKQVHSNHTLLIADACFSGSIFKSRSAFDNSSKSYEHLYSLQSRKAMTSGALKEVPDRSAFIKYLIEVLEENNQQYFGSWELFNNIRMAVMNNSENVPQYGDIKNVGDEGGEFLFIKK